MVLLLGVARVLAGSQPSQDKRVERARLHQALQAEAGKFSGFYRRCEECMPFLRHHSVILFTTKQAWQILTSFLFVCAALAYQRGWLAGWVHPMGAHSGEAAAPLGLAPLRGFTDGHLLQVPQHHAARIGET
jgi:hypothetical protein